MWKISYFKRTKRDKATRGTKNLGVPSNNTKIT